MDPHPRSDTTRARLRRTPDEAVVVLTVAGPILPDDASWLCARVGVLLEHSVDAPLVCEVAEVTAVELGTVDALASVALVARRLGRPFLLTGTTPELCELLELVGLRDVLTA